MMKNVILIRHAKSSWEIAMADYNRDLTEKGIDNSYKVANATASFVNQNAILFISPATRTSETAKIFLKVWNLNFTHVVFEQNLYTFRLSELEQIVKSCPNAYNNLILFGHNSAITDFVNKFGDVFIENVPTSGFVSITFEANQWQTITKGKTDRIIVPSLL